jgi:hypothetical protein
MPNLVRLVSHDEICYKALRKASMDVGIVYILLATRLFCKLMMIH